MWFNGDCPVCSHEIGGYEKLAQKRNLPIRFHDSIRVAHPLTAYGLRREHLERRLYLLDEQGRMFSGFGAVLALWARMPGYRLAGPGVLAAAAARDLRGSVRPHRRPGARVLGARPPAWSTHMTSGYVPPARR